jgi:F-type H+-transporting ATPase subunit gamma
VASQQDIKRRINSVRGTRRITRALELVAAARLRRAQERIESLRPYAASMRRLMSQAARQSGNLKGIPLLEERETVQRACVVVVTGDRGLAGAFNAQVLRRSFALMRDARTAGQEVRFFTIGRKAQSTVRFRGLPLAQAWTGFSDRAAYADAQSIAHAVAEAYVSGEVDRVTLVYNSFVSPLVQRVTVTDVLPIPTEALSGEAERELGHAVDFFFEPEPRQILERLLPVYVETQLYRALLESGASFFAAQMTAMRNASKSAGELIDALTLAMNRARQAEITQEILEVVAGADALTQ